MAERVTPAGAIAPLAPQPEVMAFLRSRRSRPAKTLQAPAPDAAALQPILEAAARTPDHGKLEPWRFLVLAEAALPRLAALAAARGAALGLAEDACAKAARQFAAAPLIVAVIASPKPSEKIPEIEQHLSAGAVCLALLNASMASGWGANWLTGWMAMDPVFLEDGLGVQAPEFVAGFVVLGTEGAVPPDRPRPDLDRITRWVRA